MRRYRLLVALLFFLAGLSFLYLQYNKADILPKKETQNQTAIQAPKTSIPITKTALFVPTWSLPDSELPKDYNRFIYFGVTAGTEGIALDDEETANIESFNEIVPTGVQRFFTVKMTHTPTNLTVLVSEEAQQAIIEESVKTALENGFHGIVLDFELFSILDDTIPTKINLFVEKFYNEARKNNLRFAMTIYGDVFYRKRPFDVTFLANHSDEIMIMAYDFHKSIGEPGPNFPLGGKEKYGYDFHTMIYDFQKHVDPKKLTVLFGMYGYDWIVDEQKRPIRQAKALSLNEIRKKYLDTCGKTNCVPFRDVKTTENEINYVDNGVYHIIWFEDGESVKQKTQVIQQQGIGSVGYWAYGYF